MARFQAGGKPDDDGDQCVDHVPNTIDCSQEPWRAGRATIATSDGNVRSGGEPGEANLNDDPYTILGVARTASDADIQKAYRKLAKAHHPDLNPGDTAAEERFKAASAAYQLLKDPERRGRYDRGEIDASGAERQQHPFYREYADSDRGARYASSAGYEDLGDASDFFADLFGSRAQGGSRRARYSARGQDRLYHLDLAFLDAVKGTVRRVTTPDGATLDVTIPAGIRDGGTLRLKGKGGPGLGEGPPGDALVEVSIGTHPIFTREDDDIVVELPIAIDEAVLGAKIEVPTIAGDVRVTVPKGSSSGDVLRLRGRGVKAKGRPDGNQRVVLKVVGPKVPDEALTACLEAYRARRTEDPRAGWRARA